MRVVIVTVLVVLPFSGCASSWKTSNSTRTAWHQVLEADAVDRALDRIAWPDIRGSRAFVQVAASVSKEGQAYLRQSVAAEIVARGALLVESRADAEVVVTALAAAVGTDETNVFIGLPAMQSLLLPMPFPEMALYKSTHQRGYAKTEIAFTDGKTGALLHRVGPAAGEANAHWFSILLATFEDTDSSRAHPVSTPRPAPQPARALPAARATPPLLVPSR